MDRAGAPVRTGRSECANRGPAFAPERVLRSATRNIFAFTLARFPGCAVRLDQKIVPEQQNLLLAGLRLAAASFLRNPCAISGQRARLDRSGFCQPWDTRDPLLVAHRESEPIRRSGLCRCTHTEWITCVAGYEHRLGANDRHSFPVQSRSKLEITWVEIPCRNCR